MTKLLPLLAAALLLAAGTLYADDAEDAAVKTVERLGGTVSRDEADPAHPVVGVSLAFVPATDAQLKGLSALKRLRALDLTLSQATDKGMNVVAGLDGLETLYLGYTDVTDAGLKRLAELKKLRQLNLIGTQVTDEGVAEFQKALPDCKITR
ncbi:MAG TPA: hypothetical protein VMS17_01455 [Gemmataceae bacterium]|nr:hypothetical protein [Gemmataceae bacterium]